MNSSHRCRCSAGVMIFALMLYWVSPGWALVFSEIMYHPVEDSVTGDETLEFVELYNDRAVSEDVSGWAFTKGIQYTFAPDTLVGPKTYLVVARDPNAVREAYGITNVAGPFAGRLSNDGERIELCNASGAAVLSVHYGTDRPWPVSPDGTGHSLTLAKLGGDPESASSWSASTFIGGTPGEPDQSQAKPADTTAVSLITLGSPGRYFKGLKEPSPDAAGGPTVAWTQRGFNDDPATTEWLEGPNGYGYSNDDAELQYIKTQLNDMNGNYMSIYVRLRFSLTPQLIASFSLLLAQVHYDDGFVLYLNGTRVADSGMAGDPPPFNQSGGTASDFAPMSVDLTSFKNLLVSGVNVLAMQVHNASLSGSSDCIASIVLGGIISSPATSEDPQVRLVINELLANSDAAPGVDWIELYNPGPLAVDLSNVYLSDSRHDLLCYKLPSGVVLQPGQFWAVSQGAAPDGLPFGLDFAGETVYLTSATSDPQPAPTRVLDAVRYEVTEPDVTLGRFPDGSDSFGRLSFATRGAPNARPQVNDIVINEIMYHHVLREDRYEYIELYNRGAAAVSLAGWAFTDGVEYQFGDGVVMAPGSYLVVAKDPDFLAALYDNLVVGSNLFGPYTGALDDHGERIRLSFPVRTTDPQTHQVVTHMATADEVTYCDGGRWPAWADGMGASLELRDPASDNDTPDAWADSDESGKSTWQPFTYSISANDTKYTHDTVGRFDLMLLNPGEVLLDDLQLNIGGLERLTNGGFESGKSPWLILGNHIRSFVTTEDAHTGSRSLHLMATGHGDPGSNRINQPIANVTAGNVTFSGWAKWLRGSRFLLLRTTRDVSPVQPPRPAYAFELTMPLALGTPGRQNTAFVPNRGPDILDVQHAPILPAANQSITVTARALDNDGVASVTLYYGTDGTGSFSTLPMLDNGSGGDKVAGDGIYTAAMPGAASGTMRAFYIEASDGSATTRFPTRLPPSAEVPERTCLVRVGDTPAVGKFAIYRVWISSAVLNAFANRPNLSNEVMDCTFIYNDSEIFYNSGIRDRGSTFLRAGYGRLPYPGVAQSIRLEFNPDQKFRVREELDLDSTEQDYRGPLQERACYWFFRHMGLEYSTQEYVRLIVNGRTGIIYEDVQKVDSDYIARWFPNDDTGYLHEVDDYFEYNADGTSHSGETGEEGLLYNARHPLIPETYRWHVEKRCHPEDDDWQHVYDLVVALNAKSNSAGYEQGIESQLDPNHFTKVLAIRHAIGDWDSYGYRRGKNFSLYYAPSDGRWWLLPWDMDFVLGSGDGAYTSLFSMDTNQFPELNQFLNYAKYRQMYLGAFKELVEGPWRTSYGTSDPPTPFDRFLDEASAALVAEGFGDGRRDGIKQFVRDRRTYILSQVPAVATIYEQPSGRAR
jgi:hypothetical protein